MKRTKINRTKQFQDVIKFELIKFLRSRKIRAALILTAIVPLLIYLLTNFLLDSFISQIYSDSGVVNDYQIFVNFILTLSLVNVIMFGGDSLTNDFENKTGYTLFINPISRTSFLFGKFVAASIAIISFNILFYVLASIFSYAKHSAIPENALLSLVFASLFSIGLLSTSFALSSLFKRSNMSNIAFIFLWFIVVGLMEYFLILSEIKPWWSLTYAAGIIIYIFEVPYPKDSVIDIPSLLIPGQSQTIVNLIPEVNLSIGVFLMYIIVGLMISVLFYKRKQLN
ncbi:MAG TPA: ABC transporter permease [Nitrososphaerales archaeon]|nr:ABC transporter permease [Nitrososphaerales archaeon]